MRIHLNIYVRTLHTLSGLSYLLPCYELYQQYQKIGYMLYFNSAITSSIWSLTSYGGNNGLLVTIDVYLAYLIVIYNYYKSFNWIPNKHWSNNQRIGFMLTHLSGIIFIIENILIKYNIYPKLSYGVLHFIWRLASALGSYHIFIK